MLKKQHKLLILFVLFSLPCGEGWGGVQAQTTPLDSLQKVYPNLRADTARILTLIEIAAEYRTSKPDTTLLLAEKALKQAQKIKYQKGIAWAWHRIGGGHFGKGDFDKCLEYTQKSLQLFEKIGEQKGIANCLNSIGVVYLRQGKFDGALEYLQKSLKLSEKIGEQKGIANALAQIGAAYANQGKFDEALEYFQKALKIREKIGDQKDVASTLDFIGRVYNAQGKFGEALEYYQKAFKVFEKIGEQKGMATSLGVIGQIYFQQGNYPKALEYVQKALKINEKIEDQNGIATSLNGIAAIYQEQSNYPKALEYFQKALKIVEKMGNERGIASTLTGIGYTYLMEGNYAKGIEYNQQSLQILEKMGDTRSSILPMANIGICHARLGDNAKAMDFLEKSLALSEQFNENYQKIETLYEMAKIYQLRKDTPTALRLAQQSVALAKETKNMVGIKLASEVLYQLYKAEGNYAKALEYHELFKQSQDSLFNESNTKKLKNLEAQAEIEKRELVLQKQALEIQKQKEAQAFQQRLNYLAIGGILLVLAFAFYLARLNQRQRKTNSLLQEKNEEIQQQSEELHQQAEELAAQRDSLEKANENVLLMSDIGKKITSSLEFKTIFGQLYENINQLMDATIFGVGVYHEDTQTIHYELAMERGVAFLPYTRSMQDKSQLAVKSVEEKKEILINDMSQSLHLYNLTGGGELADGTKSEEPQSLIYIPLLNNQEKALGVMSVQSYQKDAYNEYHLNILRNLAIYTSIAIENAENLHALDKEKKNLESINHELESLTEELRQQSDTVQAQRDQLAESSTQLEELLEESQTQKEILEIKNQEMESLQSTKDLMISAVNHDLRNPLNPILNYSQPDYPKFTEKERLAMINDRAKMMFALINDIMDVYRADKMQLQPQTASLYRAVSEAIAAISEAKGDLPEIINEVPENAQAIFEFKYIERVLENLLSNAVKYSENKANGGKIRFYTETVANEQGRKCYRIAIQDNGMGIPKDKFEEIFLPFSNPNAKDIGAAKSVGIGLTFCKTIVEAHHSQIYIESEVGKGTTFSFDLPLVEEFAPSNHEAQNGSVLQLTAVDKTYLAEFVPALAVFQEELFNADVRKLLKSIEANGSENIAVWKQHLEQCIDEMDEERFKTLLEMVEAS